MDWTPIWISLEAAFAATLICLVIALPLARWSARRRESWAAWLDTLILLPIALPPTVVGLALLVVFGRHSPIGAAMEQLGIFILFTWPAVVLAATVMSFPILYQSIRAAFVQIDPDLLDAARLLGYGETRILCQLMIPLAWPGLAAGVGLGFLRALGEFGATLMLAGNIPGRTQTVPLAIYAAVESGETPQAWFLAAFVLVIAIAALTALQAMNRRFAS
ncbi:MAG: molybdate ABC transporter permease subunit [Chthoniobacteraceae bacterium]